jgi:hypothetical protein
MTEWGHFEGVRKAAWSGGGLGGVNHHHSGDEEAWWKMTKGVGEESVDHASCLCGSRHPVFESGGGERRG